MPQIPKKNGPFELSTLYSQKIAKPPHMRLKGMRYASAGRERRPDAVFRTRATFLQAPPDEREPDRVVQKAPQSFRKPNLLRTDSRSLMLYRHHIVEVCEPPAASTPLRSLTVVPPYHTPTARLATRSSGIADPMGVDPTVVSRAAIWSDILTLAEIACFSGVRNSLQNAFLGSRSHPESGCILNRLPRNPRYFSVNSWMIVNISYDRYLSSRTVVDFGSCEVFSMVFV